MVRLSKRYMVQLIEDTFGMAINPLTQQSEEIKRFTFITRKNMSVQIISLGAAITSIKVPDSRGKLDDVVLGFEDLEGYKSGFNSYFGAIVGRFCNRISNGRFKLNGRDYELTRNYEGKHHHNGGLFGFDKQIWKVVGLCDQSVGFEHNSPDGSEGYPGELTTTVRYTITEDGQLKIKMFAEATKSTPVNLTNHCYFNLAGHAAGKSALCDHMISIKADRRVELNEDKLPTGCTLAVHNSPYDLRKEVKLGDRLKKLNTQGGYDMNFCVDSSKPSKYERQQPSSRSTPTLPLVAKAFHPPSGRCLEVFSNQPTVLFYTGNYLPDEDKGEFPLQGKEEAKYTKNSSFCFETQKYPDAVNIEDFPSLVVKPGERYKHEVIYKFGVVEQPMRMDMRR